MRVLHINTNYTGSLLHQTMVEHLRNYSVDNEVFVPTYPNAKSIVQPKNYVTIKECFNKWDRLLYFKKQNKIYSTICNTYDFSRFNIIHAYTLFTDGNIAMKLYEQFGIPYVVAVRNTDVNFFFKKRIALRSRGVKILNNAKAVFFLSKSYKDTVIDKYVPVKYQNDIIKKSYIIPNGIDDFWHEHLFERDYASISNRIMNEKVLKCIYVGGIDKNKNIELSLKALSLINENGWKCTLTSIGKIVDKSVYKKLCSYPFWVYVSQKGKEELVNYYRNADIFLMPSHTETFGLVYAEAMSQGLPVIFTRGQGFDGQFSEGEVGEAVDDNDVGEMVNAIYKICGKYNKDYKELTQKVTLFDWDTIAKQYVSFYKYVLNKE